MNFSGASFSYWNVLFETCRGGSADSGKFEVRTLEVIEAMQPVHRTAMI